MGNTLSPGEGAGSFIDPGEQHVTEVERPDTVVDFLEPDGMWRRALLRKSSRSLKRNVPAVRDRASRGSVRGYSRGGSGAG